MNEMPLNTSEVAKRLQCRREHVYYLIKNKQLETFKIGKRALRIKPESLERFEKCGWLNIGADGMPILEREKGALYAPLIVV